MGVLSLLFLEYSVAYTARDLCMMAPSNHWYSLSKPTRYVRYSDTTLAGKSKGGMKQKAVLSSDGQLRDGGGDSLETERTTELLTVL